MKLLIQNYTSVLTTEPMYLAECFSKTGSVKTHVWNTNAISTFDILDSFNPDVLLCHYSTPTLNDIFKYFSSNKKTELVINVTGAQESHVKILESLIEKNGVNCPFFISNLHNKIQILNSKKKILNILPAVDLFLQKQVLPEFKLNAGILSNSKELAEKALKNIKTYHKIGIGVQDEFFDFTVNVSNMNSLYEKYDKIILASDLPVAFSQLFFDAVFKSKKVVLKTGDEKKSGEILADLFDANEEDEDVSTAIKNQIKNKHTCFNRAERFARALKLENTAKILNDLGNKI